MFPGNVVKALIRFIDRRLQKIKKTDTKFKDTCTDAAATWKSVNVGNREVLLIIQVFLVDAQVDQYPEEERTGALLRDVACTWMNRPWAGQLGGVGGVGVGVGVGVGGEGAHDVGERNYDRWSRFLRTKQKLRIGGIFPMRGNKFRAPELLPGEELARTNVLLVIHRATFSFAVS